MSKIDEIFENMKGEPVTFEEFKEKAKFNSLFKKKQAEEIIEEVEEERRVKIWVVVLAIIGVIAIGCFVAYLIYRKRKPDYLADFDDEFEANEEDDFFEDDDD